MGARLSLGIGGRKAPVDPRLPGRCPRTVAPPPSCVFLGPVFSRSRPCRHVASERVSPRNLFFSLLVHMVFSTVFPALVGGGGSPPMLGSCCNPPLLYPRRRALPKPRGSGSGSSPIPACPTPPQAQPFSPSRIQASPSPLVVSRWPRDGPPALTGATPKADGPAQDSLENCAF